MCIIAALLGAVCTSEARGSPELWYSSTLARGRAISVPEVDVRSPMDGRDVERLQASGAIAKPVRLAQAASDPEEIQKTPEQERAALLAREMTINRQLEVPPTLDQAGTDTAHLRQLSEREHTKLREYLEQERVRMKQAVESATAEFCKTLSGDRSEQPDQAAAPTDTVTLRTSLQLERDKADRLEQDLAAAKRDFAKQMALVAEATQQATQAKGQAESDVAGLKTSLQQERDRATQLEKDLASARRDVETQTALASKATESASQSRQAGSDAAELKASLQQERDRATQLEKDLASARRDAETQMALASKATESASQSKQAGSDAAELKASLQQERDRATQLEKDLASARHDVKTQTALASKATEYDSQSKQAESDAAGLKASLQQERDRASQLEKDLASARHDVETQTALASKVTEYESQSKQAESDAAGLKTSLQQERDHEAQLEKDLTSARHDVETQTALVSKANQDAVQLKQVTDQGSAELKWSLQKEHERAEGLAKDLSTARATVYAYEAQARRANDQAAVARQAGESGAAALRTSLQQEQEHAGRLEQDLAAARHTVETQTALAVKANEDAARSKQAADNDSADLKRSLQKEHDKAEALAQSLSLVHTAIYTYEVQARMASDQAVARAQSATSSAAELRKSLQQEQARSARLQQDLLAARHDVETQTGLAAKAGAEAARFKHAAESSSAESPKSLQQEREKAARLEREMASERKTKDVPAVSGGATTGRATQDRQAAVDAIRPVAVNQATVAAVRAEVRPDPQSAAEVARLVARASVLLEQGDIGSARIVLERAAETGNAQANFALAETYDPLVLRKWGAYGTLGDAAKARDLYARAQAGGVRDAKERFDALRR